MPERLRFSGRIYVGLDLFGLIAIFTGKPENRKTGKPENRKTGKPENRKTGILVL